MGVRAKFTVEARTERVIGATGDRRAWWEAQFRAVRPTPLGEDSIYGKYSPAGKANLTGLKPPAAEAFAPDRTFYVDFSPEHEERAQPEGAFRLRMICQSVKTYRGSDCDAHEVELHRVWAKDDEPEAILEPNGGGHLSIAIHNPPAGRQFSPGAVFWVDFVPTADPSY